MNHGRRYIQPHSLLRTSRRQRIIQPNVRSTIQRSVNRANPWPVDQRTTSTTKLRSAALSSSWRWSYAPSPIECLIHGQRCLGAVDLFSGVVFTARRTRRLNRLAADDGYRRLFITPLCLSIEHRPHIMDDLKQKAAHKTPKPPVDRLPRRKVDRHHALFAARPHKVANGIEDLAQISDAMTTSQGGLVQQLCDEFLLRIHQVARVTLAGRSALRLARTRLLGPHDVFRLNALLDIIDRTKIVFSNGH